MVMGGLVFLAMASFLSGYFCNLGTGPRGARVKTTGREG